MGVADARPAGAKQAGRRAVQHRPGRRQAEEADPGGRKPEGRKKPAATVTDGRVREDALECLRSARAVWSRGESVPSPELVWDQLWSILEEGGVLKKK